MRHLYNLRQIMPFSNIGLPGGIPLSLGDIFLALILAYIIRTIIRLVGWIFFPANMQSRMLSSDEYRHLVVQRCFELFPIKDFQFKGETYQRGMKIRVITNTDVHFEGTFLGLNNENLICVLTDENLAADATDNIKQILLLGQGENFD
ncbi:MAG: hypothetical protein FWB71_06180 [Defluviitaleaceae bacterium]|nr:hypothetical protein [Defluviitaleaceae bacterium]